MTKPICLILVCLVLRSHAGCCLRLDPADCFAGAKAVAELETLATQCLRNEDGQISTRHTVRVIHAFKGELPETFTIDTLGGCLDGVFAHRSDQPKIPTQGETFVAHLTQCAKGNWHAQPFNLKPMPDCEAHQQALREFFAGEAKQRLVIGEGSVVNESDASGGSPGSTVTSTGFFETSGGLPSRFLSCDRGQPIGYLIDMDPAHLPTEVSPAEAVAAVEACLASWASNTSLTFRFDGFFGFGEGASDLEQYDGRLYIQLHDSHDVVTNSGTLGIGGGAFWENAPPLDVSGGTVDGEDFAERLDGYVVLNHPSLTSFSENDFTEVLCHEIGHSLGLEHSSESDPESVSALEDATMYFQVHKDSRGASIRTYDDDHIQCAYPASNTPPYSDQRFLRVVTGSSQPTGLGVDRVEIVGGDLQNNALALIHLSTFDDTYNGSFSKSGIQLVFTPDDDYSDDLLTDGEIAGGFYFDACFFRLSDGTHISPT